MCRQTHVVVELPMITLGAGGWRRSGSIRHPWTGHRYHLLGL